MAKPKKKKLKNVESLTTDQVMQKVFGRQGQKDLKRTAEHPVQTHPNRKPA